MAHRFWDTPTDPPSPTTAAHPGKATRSVSQPMLANSFEIALDTCQYPEGQAPDARLGRIWATCHIPDDQRIALAKHIKAIGQMANLASSVPG